VEDEEEGEAGKDEVMKKVSKVVKTEDEEEGEGDEENELGDGDDDAVEEVKVLDEWGVAKQSVSSATVLAHMRTYWDLLQHFSVYQSWSKELKGVEAAREKARAEGRASPPWDGNEAWRRRLQEKYAPVAHRPAFADLNSSPWAPANIASANRTVGKQRMWAWKVAVNRAAVVAIRSTQPWYETVRVQDLLTEAELTQMTRDQEEERRGKGSSD